MITVRGECLGLRFCEGEGDREMGEMELEEGEAYSYHNIDDNNGDDCIDPDVAFSYMDMKIQDVLGHFQKDFEGVVTAENLGAKFGEYGSFLPTYQRSPGWSHSRCSPIPSHLEGTRRSDTVPVAASKIQSHGSAKSSTPATSRSKLQSVDSSKQEKCMPPLRTVEEENSYESASRKSSSSVPDQKMLKVRIKLGSSYNPSTQNKAAIYTGLGLDASPTSSLDESAESEGMSCGPMEMGGDSPTSILQIMTACPLDGDLLLSPLTEDLIHCTEKKRPLEGQRGKKLFDGSISKLVEKKDNPSELKSSSSKKSKKKELDIDSVACEDLILKTMELPIISGAEANGVSARVQSVPHRGQEDLSHSAGKVLENERITRELEADFLAPRYKNTLNTEGPSSRGKKKVKRSQNECNQFADPAKESLSGSSSVTNSKKSIGEDISKTVSENGELKSRKVLGKSRDIYRDFFGEFEQEEENRAGRLGPDTANARGRPVENNTKLKDRESHNVIATVPTSEVHLNAAPNVAPPAPVAPFVIKENWVCCDKCERWRLLPAGKDPNSLPKKWICSMLDWMPGKNRCSVSETETNAGATSQSIVPLNSEMPALAPAAGVRNPDEHRLNPTPEAPPVGGKKKHGMKQVINPSVAGGPSDSEQATKSKHIAYDHHSDGGNADTLRSSKKVRNIDIQSGDEDRRSAGGSATRKLGKNGKSSDRARMWKPESADEVPPEQPRESLQNVNSDAAKSVSKKRNRDRESEAPMRDNDEHRKGKKARVSKNDRKESSEKCGLGSVMKSSKKEAKDLPPSLGPTSTSYKAVKSKFDQEVNGSPAESVSSSPMRSLKADMPSSMVTISVEVEEKENTRSLKYEGEADKRKASHGQVKPRNGERKRIEDEHHKSAGKIDSTGKACESGEKSLKRGSSSRADQIGDEARIKKSKALTPSGASLPEAPHVSTKPTSGPTKMNKAPKPSETVTPANGTRHPSDRRDSFAQAAANALKEAKDLKHLADRVKASGSNLEGTGLYFQAALKFLRGASLLESSFNASSKYSEMIQSVQTYSSTAKLCEFCAHEYEKSKDMASAALAYKCMEVAYMKVVYSSQNTASRDCQELQTALKLVPPGESPSSSASDLDHVNNTTAIDSKGALPKDENPPQVAGNHVITARNRPNFERLLNFAQDVNSAMEASRKSMAAFNAAGSKSGDTQQKEVISSIKRAIDFNFQDVEGLLQLVRIATEAISR